MAELSVLDALLGAKPVTEITSEVRIERLGVDFTVKALSGDDVKRLREECTRYEIRGKERKAFIDNEELTLAMVVASTENNEFNFGDAKLLKHFGVKTATQCVSKALTFGELSKLAEAVTTISGLNDDEQIEEVKN